MARFLQCRRLEDNSIVLINLDRVIRVDGIEYSNSTEFKMSDKSCIRVVEDLQSVIWALGNACTREMT